MTDVYLLCPDCGHVEAADERADCPACGGGRTYLNHAPAWPDATGEAYVKLDAEDAEARAGSGSADE